MASRLTTETLQIILSFIDATELPSLALVSPAFSSAARLLLAQDATVTRSTRSHLLVRTLQNDPVLPSLVQSITLSRRTGKSRMRKTNGDAQGKGSRKKGKGPAVEGAEEDELTADDMALLLSHLRHVAAVHLRELSFTSLRRRHIGSFPSTHLTSLSISGCPEFPFHLASVGRMASPCHQLKRLALRHVQVHSSAFEGVPPAGFELSSLALFETPNLEHHHLFWLLRSTAYAESLRSLALNWDESPKTLNSIRYVTLRVSSLCLSTRTPGVVEAFVLHCPSLKVLEICATAPVDLRVFENLELPLASFLDRSPPGGGLPLGLLRDVIQRRTPKFAREIKLVQVGSWSVDGREEEELRGLCGKNKVALWIAPPEQEEQVNREGVWIPQEFASLRKVEFR